MKKGINLDYFRYDENETKERSHRALTSYCSMNQEQVTRLKKALKAIKPQYAEIIFYKYIDCSLKDKAIYNRLNMNKTAFYKHLRNALVDFSFAFDPIHLVAWADDAA